MFREIRTREKITDTFEKKEEGFRKIKPQTEMSMQELNDICRQIFEEARMEAARN